MSWPPEPRLKRASAGIFSLHGSGVAVVEAPYGAHPSASPSLYRSDDRHLKEYVKASASEDGFAAYLQRYAYGASNQAAYLEQLGGARLGQLAVSETNLS